MRGSVALPRSVVPRRDAEQPPPELAQLRNRLLPLPQPAGMLLPVRRGPLPPEQRQRPGSRLGPDLLTWRPRTHCDAARSSPLFQSSQKPTERAAVSLLRVSRRSGEVPAGAVWKQPVPYNQAARPRRDGDRPRRQRLPELGRVRLDQVRLRVWVVTGWQGGEPRAVLAMKARDDSQPAARGVAVAEVQHALAVVLLAAPVGESQRVWRGQLGKA